VPRVNVPVTQAVRAGVVLPAAVTGDATNNHSVANDGRVAVIVKNTGASSRTVTFYTTKSVDGLTPATRAESIPAGEEQLFGPFDPTVYGTTLDIDVTSAELTLRAIRI
jgi:hypothetical protein